MRQLDPCSELSFVERTAEEDSVVVEMTSYFQFQMVRYAYHFARRLTLAEVFTMFSRASMLDDTVTAILR